MRNSILGIILILVVLLQFLNQLFFEVPIIIMAGIILLSFLIVDEKLLIGLYCFYIPVSVPIILYLVNIVFVIVLLFKLRHNIKFSSTIFYVLLISLIESIHVYVNMNAGKDESIINLLEFILCLISFIFIYYVEYSTFNIINNVQRFGFSTNDGDMNNNELLLNPNTIGVYSALIVAIIIVLQKFKVINNNLIVWFMFSYAILIGLLTVSRTFLLIITVLFLLYLFSSIIKKNMISFFVGVGLFIAALMVFLSNTQLSRTIHARLFESDDISGSRFLIYKEYLNVIFSNENIF